MPIELPGGCRVFGLREGEPRTDREGLSVWRHVGRELGATAISLSVLELEPGASCGWRNGDCDEILSVLEGESALKIAGESHTIARGAGIYVRPGDRINLENTDRSSLTLLSCRCPDPGPEISFEDKIMSGESLSSRGAQRRGMTTENGSRSLAALGMTESRLPSPVVRFEDQPTERAGDGRWFRVLVDASVGCEQVTQFIGFIPPGRAPDHFHEYEEVACILSGAGRFWSGDSSTPIAAGSCLYLPRRQPHCVENTGTETLQLCGLFYPAGSPAIRYHPGGASA